MGEIRDRMTADLKIGGYSEGTQKIYLMYVNQFVRHFRRSPLEMGADEIRVFLLHMVTERQLSRETVRITRAALKFLYTVTLRRPVEVDWIPVPRHQRRLPEVLSGTDVARLLQAARSLKYRAVLETMYAGGLRISEACSLRVQDIDSKRGMIRVRGKGVDLGIQILQDELTIKIQFFLARHLLLANALNPVTVAHQGSNDTGLGSTEIQVTDYEQGLPSTCDGDIDEVWRIAHPLDGTSGDPSCCDHAEDHDVTLIPLKGSVEHVDALVFLLGSEQEAPDLVLRAQVAELRRDELRLLDGGTGGEPPQINSEVQHRDEEREDVVECLHSDQAVRRSPAGAVRTVPLVRADTPAERIHTLERDILQEEISELRPEVPAEDGLIVLGGLLPGRSVLQPVVAENAEGL